MATRGSEALRRALFGEGHGAGEKLATTLGADSAQVSKWRNGVHAPNSGVRLRLQELFEIPWQWWDEPLPDPDDIPAPADSPEPSAA